MFDPFIGRSGIFGRFGISGGFLAGIVGFSGGLTGFWTGRFFLKSLNSSMKLIRDFTDSELNSDIESVFSFMTHHKFEKKFKGTPLGYFIKRFMMFHLYPKYSGSRIRVKKAVYFLLLM